jgi:hypothetical protein
MTHPKHRIAVLTAFAAAIFLALSNGAVAELPTDEIDFSRDIRPILSDNCFACHGFDEAAREADLRLDTFDGATADSAIVPGEPDQSELVARIFSDDPDSVMPPTDTGKSLSREQKEMLLSWIQQGAVYQTHWSFTPPERTSPPRVALTEHPIDRFIQTRLAQEGLGPSELATSETLIRRVSLDLTGLPPTLRQLDEFAESAATDPQAAYGELVERLLASPHYGERWGRWWLDQARYADSNGYSVDAPRNIWLYRDWVIQALNDDMPFDTFTIEQLAGDLLPDATQSQRIATGFHRNTQINQEGGIDKEQFRIDSVFDRVATTGTVWLGLTIGCAQCHDHKFDPITQVEYYRMFAFLNNQSEPTLNLKIDDKKTSTMVLKERREPRQTHVLIKGDFTRPSDEVTPGTPSVLHPFESESEHATRLDLAKWIVSSQNPLTARVIVNRIWQQYFGRGLSEIENDFGLQGALPSHPELLDWLATEFIDRQWSMKEMHRLIVTSHTYRQTSNELTEWIHKDPENYLLGRQQRLRLDAEIVRDVALTASGLLSSSIGGSPVFPPIPEGVMSQGQVKRPWKTSSGGDRFRRGLYTFKFRATPPPSLNVFDAPDGFSSCTRRVRSNTPLQALTLMNDPAYVEFAERLQTIIEADGLASAFRRCTSRNPSDDEIAFLSKLDSFGAARAMLNLDETITRE